MIEDVHENTKWTAVVGPGISVNNGLRHGDALKHVAIHIGHGDNTQEHEQNRCSEDDQDADDIVIIAGHRDGLQESLQELLKRHGLKWAREDMIDERWNTMR